MNNNQTVGKIASELWSSSSGSADPREIRQATEQEYMDNLVWCVDHAKKRTSCNAKCEQFCKDRPSMDGSFFVVCILKREKLLENVLRNYFIPASACPTPTFDQTVFRYNHEKDAIEYIWTVPDKDTCEIYYENRDIVVPNERALLSMVISFYDGSLGRICKKFNGETEKTPSIILENLDNK